MKHVFVINSHTTFLTSMGVVRYLKIEEKDVVFIYMRSYSNAITKVSYKTVDATSLADSYKNITSQYSLIIHKTDLFVSQHICGKYHLYIPHLCHHFFQLLYTNPLCRRIAYIQEGGPAQTKVFDCDVTLFERVRMFVWLAIRRKRTFECKWYRKGIIYKQIGLDSYAINDNYFQCLPSHNHIIRWQVDPVDVPLQKEFPIFIFDGYVSNRLVDYDTYMKLCNKIITEQSKSVNYVKFHPAQTKCERDNIMRLFERCGVIAELMSDDIPMEYIIVQNRNHIFVGFTSSLLYYARDNGHKVISYEKYLLQASDTFRQYVDMFGFQTFDKYYG